MTLPHLAHIARDYDEALAFHIGKLGSTLSEGMYQPEQDKRSAVSFQIFEGRSYAKLTA